MAQARRRTPYDQPPENPYDAGFTHDPESFTGNTGISGGTEQVQSPSAPQPQDWSQGPWDANRVRSYFQSRGVTPNETSPDYWAGRWNEWGQRDPQYFMQRLSHADEIIGGPQNSPWAGAGGGVNAGAVSPFTSQIRQMLMQRLGQASQPVSANDPTIDASVSAAKVEGERTGEQTRKALAERLYASGQGHLDTGAAAQGALASQERMATGLGTLRAQLMQRELEGRRSEMQSLLQQALASGDAETARAIQMQIANLEATLRREGYGINMAMFGQQQNTLPFNV